MNKQKPGKSAPIISARFKEEKITVYRIYDSLLNKYFEGIDGQIAFTDLKACIYTLNYLNTQYINAVLDDWNIYKWLIKNRSYYGYTPLYLRKKYIDNTFDWNSIKKYQLKTADIEKIQDLIEYNLIDKWIDKKRGLNKTIKTAIRNHKAEIKIEINFKE